MCKSSPYYFHWLYRSTFILLSGPQSVSWVFSCFRNPPKSDMSYRIFNVRMWSFLCVRIHTRGLSTQTASQHNIFDSEKLNNKNIVLLTGFEPQSFASWVRRSTNWATPVTPCKIARVYNFLHGQNLTLIQSHKRLRIATDVISTMEKRSTCFSLKNKPVPFASTFLCVASVPHASLQTTCLAACVCAWRESPNHVSCCVRVPATEAYDWPKGSTFRKIRPCFVKASLKLKNKSLFPEIRPWKMLRP